MRPFGRSDTDLRKGIVVVIVRGEGLKADLDIPLTRFLYPEVELEGA